MFGYEPVDSSLTHLNNCSRHHRDGKGKINISRPSQTMEKPCNLFKDIHYRKDDSTPSKPTNNAKFDKQQ